MRTLGLIVGFAVSLFLTGWLLLDVDGKSVKTEERFSTRDILKQNAIDPQKKSHSDPTPNSPWAFPAWLQRPIGVVRYPDFPPINFLPIGD